jgi:hypothetical protein
VKKTPGSQMISEQDPLILMGVSPDALAGSEWFVPWCRVGVLRDRAHHGECEPESSGRILIARSGDAPCWLRFR